MHQGATKRNKFGNYKPMLIFSVICLILITLVIYSVSSDNQISVELEYDKPAELCSNAGNRMQPDRIRSKYLSWNDETKIRQYERMSRLRQGCSKYPSDRALKANVRFFHYQNVTWCVLPKTGTANNLRLVCMMVGPICNDEIGDKSEHEFVPQFVQKIDDSTLRSCYLNRSPHHKFTYTFVRNPWTRLVSTYIQKFIQLPAAYIILCRVNSDHHSFQRQKNITNSIWSFGDFIERCVVGEFDKGGHKYMDEHWRPQYIGSDICNIDYNFIGKTETYNEDMRVILAEYGVADPQTMITESYSFRRENEKHHDTKKLYQDYWESIKPKTIKRLQEIYSRDFEYFDYPTKPL